MNEDYENFDGHMSNTLINVTREGNNWKGEVTLVQGRLPKGEKWEHLKVEFMSVKDNPEVVIGDLVLTLSSYLESCDGNLFQAEKGGTNVKTDSNEIAQ